MTMIMVLYSCLNYYFLDINFIDYNVIRKLYIFSLSFTLLHQQRYTQYNFISGIV